MKKLWKPKIGLEIHAQVSSISKLFSPASSQYHAITSHPNSCLNLFDVAFPGTLPRLNRYVIQQAVRTAHIFSCTINKVSMFERKHYFYQDLPLGYQITQQLRPIATNGHLDYSVYNKNNQYLYQSKLNITRIQIEQDSGKSIHDRHPKYSLVDLNRAGVALLEIVFEPDITNSDEAVSAIKAIQKLLRHLNICDGNLQDGSMRCDVNISVAEEALESNSKERIVGNRVEIKNLNSMQRVSDAIEFEIQRHIQILELGDQVTRETRKFDVETGTTSRLRSKETAVDYRIFPDPDLPLLMLTDEEIHEMISSDASETPEQTAFRLMEKYSLSNDQANRLITSMGIKYYEETIENLSQQQRLVLNSQIYHLTFNWIFGDLMMHLNELGQSLENSIVTPQQMSEILLMTLSSDDKDVEFLSPLASPPTSSSSSSEEKEERITISGPQAKTLLKALFHPNYHGTSPTNLVIQNQWKLITDVKKIRELALEAIQNPKNSKQLKKYFSGNQGMVKFFFGEVMKGGKGQVDPKKIEKIVIDVLGEQQQQLQE